MSKKIIPIITLLGASALIVGATIKPTREQKESYSNHIDAFEESLSEYVSTNPNLTSKKMNKYTLALQENLNDTNQELKPLNDEPEITTEEKTTEVENAENIITDDSQEMESTEETLTDNSETLEQISTLYSISSDIESSCDDFCELKTEITNAIVETQNLIDKVQQKEIELTNEQRLFITEQAQQLKNLGRQLSSITTELSFNLSDLNQIMSANSTDIDNLSLKYLVVLDNLVNGNEMIQSGLTSLNLINQMFNMRSNGVVPNNYGRILYGFQHNDNPPIVKDYYIDENGNVVENDKSNEENSDETNLDQEKENNKTNIDTYQNNNLNTNLDTYNNTNLNRNIDSFFNTALLDNEFMYGNGAYGMGGMYGNPYMQEYVNYEKNTSNSVNRNNNTQNDVQNNNENISNPQTKKDKKGFKLKKNIDTFKDENEPDIKTKLGNIKNSISGFFAKFKKSDLNDKIDNPVYRYNASDNQETNS